jgi:hypothetical protein
VTIVLYDIWKCCATKIDMWQLRRTTQSVGLCKRP